MPTFNRDEDPGPVAASEDASFLAGGRARQHWDLIKQSVWTEIGPFESTLPPDAPNGVWLSVYVKDRPRGAGYIADFLYRSISGLPVWVYGTVVNVGRGLVINELELWRPDAWEFRDEDGLYVGPDGHHDVDLASVDAYVGISSSTVRDIPLGWILATLTNELAERSWEQGDLFLMTAPDLESDERGRRYEDMEQRAVATLDRSAEELEAAAPRRRGRPSLPDDLLEAVARAYLEEAPTGVGLTARMAARFIRPEPTIRDWIGRARHAGFLSPAQPGRRGAGPGPRLRA